MQDQAMFLDCPAYLGEDVPEQPTVADVTASLLPSLTMHDPREG